LLVLGLCLADIALVLDLDEVDLDDDSTDLDNVSDDMVSLDGLQKGERGIRLEVTDLVFDFTDYLQALRVVEELNVDI